MNNYYVISKMDLEQEILAAESREDALRIYRVHMKGYPSLLDSGAYKCIHCAVYCTSTTYKNTINPFSSPEVTSRCEFICGFSLVSENQD